MESTRNLMLNHSQTVQVSNNEINNEKSPKHTTMCDNVSGAAGHLTLLLRDLLFAKH